ncbi:non-ribosomal peptide synthase/polyketide synthase [Tistrella mobilis]|uniref:non-ribosomal peptide synthase/polyketide synthase n=1 Tax=Tistrella mobilis TaxID=171437 RepID=UPI0035576EAA
MNSGRMLPEDRRRKPTPWTARLIRDDGLVTPPPPAWLPPFYDLFHAKVTDPAYPCFFGTLAERKGEMFYAWVDRADDLSGVPAAMATFLRLAAERPEEKNNFALFFPPEPEPLSHSAYRDRFWRVLQHLHDHDPAPTFETLETEPDDAAWEFGFGGEQMFAVGCAPSYKARDSRNLGPGMVILFQPRSVFIDTITKREIGAEARSVVRKRLLAWDGQPVHPDLGVYGDTDNREWKQYFLADGNDPEAGRCPFLVRRDRSFAETLTALLVGRGRHQADLPAITFVTDGAGDRAATERHLTYGALDARARDLAARLADYARPGDRVMLVLPAGPDYVVGLFACLYAGLIAVPARAGQGADPAWLQAIRADATPHILLTNKGSEPIVANMAITGDETVIYTDADPAAAPRSFEPVVASAESLAFLLYEPDLAGSGPAVPRGVMHSHGSVMAALLVARRLLGLARSDVVVNALPLDRAAGLIGGVLAAIFAGLKLVMVDPDRVQADPVLWLRAIAAQSGETSGSTISGGTDALWRRCLDRVQAADLAGLDLSRWRVAWCATGTLPVEVLKALCDRLAPAGFAATALHPCHGLAEAGLLIAGATPGQGARIVDAPRGSARIGAAAAAAPRLIACGPAAPGHDIAIIDPATRHRLPAGTIGEIWTRGPAIAGGYWNRPDATAATFDARIAGDDAIDNTPWLRTGRLGTLIDDQLVVCGQGQGPAVTARASLPATVGQQGFWIDWRLDPADARWNVSARLSLTGDLAPEAVRAAVAAMVARHDALRVRFAEDDGTLWQLVAPEPVFDWRAGVDADLDEAARRPFDLARGPLLRADLIADGPGRHLLQVVVHHAVTDGWSAGIMLRDLMMALAGRRLRPAPDYAAAIRSVALDPDHLARELAWWQARLAGETPELHLPRRAGATSGGPGRRVSRMVSATLAARLAEAGRARGATRAVVLLAGFAALLHRHGGTTATRIGIARAGRAAAASRHVVGFFVNTLVLHTDLPAGLDAGGLIDRVRDGLREAEAHGDLPFPRLVAALRPDRRTGRNPLVRVMFNHQPGRLDRRLADGPAALAGIELDPGTAEIELSLGISETADGLAIAFDHAAAAFAAEDVERLADDYLAILEALAAGPAQRLGALPVSLPAPHPAATPAFRPAAFRPAAARIAARAAADPAAPALIVEGQSWSRGRLDRWSDHIARDLRDAGLAPEERVGLDLPRGAAMVAGLLGILKAGGAVVPLDPALPAARRALILADAGVRRVLTEAPEPEASDAAPVLEPVAPGQIAYVIHTSGSTGTPKGVAVPQDALSAHLDDYTARYDLTDADRVLQFSTLGFDAAFEQLLPVLAAGGTAVLRGPEIWDHATLNARLAADRVTLAYLPTGYWRRWLDDLPGSLPDLRLMVVGAEALGGDAVGLWRAGPLGHIPLRNSYGPTEATITATDHETGPSDIASPQVAIGRPWPARLAEVLDAHGNPVPVGGVGELCLGGVALARGYLNRPGQTAERFVPAAGGGRLYRTGDLVRPRADGTLDFLGRADSQIKLRGYRIEPGEVEAALRRQPGVRDAVVGLIAGRLVAHVAGAADPAALTTALGANLPGWMVPQAILVLDALPLTPAGKIDRRALPSPALAEVVGEEAKTTNETLLLTIARDLLGRSDLGVTDDLFAAGADSILVLQLVARARTAGLVLTPRAVFDRPRIDRLAAMAETGAAPALLPPLTGTDLPLTPIQRRFLARHAEPVSPWNQAVLLELTDNIRAQAIASALGRLVALHDALRLRLRRDADGGWHQWIAAEEGAELLVSPADPAALHAMVDPVDGPVLRAALIAGSPRRLMITIHHLAVDGVSWRILLDDLATLLGGGDPAPATTPWSRWVAALPARAAAVQDAADIWRRRLAGAAPTFSPHRAGRRRRAELIVDAAAARDEVLLAALSRALGRPALVEIETHGRDLAGPDTPLDRTVGWFTATHPMVVTPQDDDRVLVAGLRAARLGLPPGGAAHALVGGLDDLPPPDIAVNNLGRFAEGAGPLRLVTDMIGDPSGGHAPEHALVLDALTIGDRLHLRFDADEAVLDLDRFAERFAAALDRLGRAGLPEDAWPATPMQQGMIFHGRLAPADGLYVNQLCLDLAGRIDPAALEVSWNAALARHPILRSRFAEAGDGSLIQIVEPEARLRLNCIGVDADGYSIDVDASGDKYIDVDAFLRADAARGIDTATAPLMRLTLLRGARADTLVWTCHHAITDGWSSARLLAEIAGLADIAGAGQGGSYRDYVAWAAGRPVDAGWWRARAAGVTDPVLLLPALGRPEAPVAGRACRTTRLDPARTAALKSAAAAAGVTLATLVQGAWALTLARLGGRNQVAFGVTVSGRPADLPGVEAIQGPFLASLPVWVDLPGSAPLAPWLRVLQSETVDLAGHAHTGLAEIGRITGLGAEGLFDSLLVVENYPLDPRLMARGFGAPVTAARMVERTHFPLTLAVIPEAGRSGEGECLALRFDHDATRLDHLTIAALAEGLADLLGQLAADINQDLGNIALALPGGDAGGQRGGAGDAATPFTPVLTPIAVHAAADPDRPAVTMGDDRLTRGALDRLSNRIARQLIGAGIATDRLVGLCLDRSPALVAGALGILKAGGAYVPLDPAYPEERLAGILDDAALDVIVTDQATADALADLFAGRTLVLVNAPEAADDSPLSTPIHPDQLAYVIYTSGSTGRPKGVGITHRNLARLLTETSHWYGFGPDDVWPLFHSFAFDVSVWEIFGALSHGGRLVVVPWWTARDATAFHGLLRAERVTVLNQTPSAFLPLMQADMAATDRLTDLRVIVFAGEKLEPAALADWLAWRGDTAPVLVNMYGITETTVHVTYRETTAADATRQPPRSLIGVPIPDLSLHVVDADLNPTPVFGTGELLVGGPGLARGYLGRPALTAERFIPDPFGAPGGRLYRSGDLVHLMADGMLDYVGRNDFQVKIRGFRIELGEINAALLTAPGIREAAALAVDDGAGAKRVLAWLVMQPGVTLDAAALRSHLAARLAPHMIPAGFIALDRMPLTVNGKLDRARLPMTIAPEAGSGDGPGYEKPATATEAALARIWAGVLGLPRLGRTEDPFLNGADSLLAMRALARIRTELGVDPGLKALFDHPTVAELAKVVDAAKEHDLEMLPARADTSRAPLAPGQDGLWFLWQLDPASTAYTVAGALSLRGAGAGPDAGAGPVDATTLRRAVADVVARHEALRVRFTETPTGPVQLIDPAPRFVWQEIDLTAAPETLPDLLAGFAAEPFDLTAGPLLRARLVTLAPDHRVLALATHHIVADGWSMTVLAREIAALCRGRHLDAPVSGWGDWSAAARAALDGGRLADQIAWWQAELGRDHPVLRLPVDRVRKGARSDAGGRVERRLDAEAMARIRAAGRGATLFVTLLAAFDILLHRQGGDTDIRIGVPVAGRTGPGTEDMVGFFVNTLVLKAEIAGGMRFGELVDQLRRRSLEVWSRQDVPFAVLVDRLGAERSLERTPLFQVMFNLQQQDPAAAAPGEGIEVDIVENPVATARFDLVLDVVERPDGLRLAFDYAADIFDAATITGLADQYLHLLEQITTGADPLIATLALPAPRPAALPAAPIRQRFDPVAARILRRAAEIPAREAIACEGIRVSYGQLDALSNRVAAALIAAGLRPEERVGLLLTRTADLPAALVGVLRAGGAFVPLDPAYPEDRLADMAADAGIRLVLADAATEATLPGLLAGRQVIRLGALPEGVQMAPVLARVHPDQLAYVIYTSGSTGRPKGVAISQDAFSLHLDDFLATYGIGDGDVVLQQSTLNFDVALHEMLPALIMGGRIVMRGPAMWDLAALSRVLAEERVTFSRIPTAYWQQWLRDPPRNLPHLRQVTVGGEGLPGDALRRWQEGPLGHIRLDNLYGPTETTVACMHRITTPEDAGALIVPIGTAYPGRTVAIIDADGNHVPVGGYGELCIQGDSLARGYLGRPGQTAERFVPDEQACRQGAPGARLYRTGDLCRMRRDGTVDFLGRLDAQVKLRGFRIEPGEIEAAMRACPGVEDAVVALIGSGEGARLAGYVTGTADPAAVAAALGQRLPAHMVPASITPLAALPLMPNGKVDRKALPVPELAAAGEIVGPTTDAEAALLDIWQAVLARADFGVTDGFFELGGDSILSLQVVARARAAGWVITPTQIFTHPRIDRLATVATPAATQAIAAEIAGTPLPLTPIQRGFFDRHPDGPSHWNQAVLLTLDPAVTAEALGAALAALVARHDALRLRFAVDGDGVWTQNVAPAETAELLICRTTTLEGLEDACTDVQASLDIRTGPMLRAGLFELPGGARRLLIAIHHLAVDGVSWRILGADLDTALSGASLAPVPMPWSRWVADRAALAATSALDDQAAWWRRAAEGAEPCFPDRTGPRGLTQSWQADPALTAALIHDLPRRYGLGVEDLLTTTLARLLATTTGRTHIGIDLEGHGRDTDAADAGPAADISRTIGWFTARYTLALPGAGDTADILAATRQALKSVPHGGRDRGWISALDDLPRADVSLNYLGRVDLGLAGNGRFALAPEGTGRRTAPGTEGSGHALAADALIRDGRLVIDWRSDGAVADAAALRDLADRFGALLAELVETCRETPPALVPADVPLAGLDAAALRRLGLTLGTTEDAYPATGLQEGLLLHAGDDDDGLYINQLHLDLDPKTDVDALIACWHAAIRRHAILRTRFAWDHGGAALQIVERDAVLPVARLDWRNLDAAGHDRRLAAWATEDRRRGIDPAVAPLARLTLIARPDGGHDLFWTSHHALSDGWSLALLMGEIAADYAARIDGTEAGLPPVRPWRDHVAATLDAGRRFAPWWQAEAARRDDPALLLPLLTAPTVPAGEVAAGAFTRHTPLDEAATARLAAAAARAGVTLATLVEAAWALTLGRLGHRNQAVFGVTMSGRGGDLAGIDRMIGLFINSLPLVVDLPGAMPVNQWLQNIQTTAASLRAAEATPLATVQRLTGLAGDALFDSLLVFENYPVDGALADSRLGRLVRGLAMEERTHYAATLAAVPGRFLDLRWGFDGARVSPSDADRLAARFLDLLTALPDHLDQVLGRLAWPADPVPQAAAQPFRAVTARLAAAAAARPDATAITCEGVSITHAALDRHANQVARRVPGAGTADLTDTPIGLCVTRGPALVAGLVGILKAGAVAVPLDADLPDARLAQIIAGAGLSLVVADAAGRARLAGFDLRAIPVEEGIPAEEGSEAAPAIDAVRHPQALAYLLYTSGSTGTPKGVAIPHGALAAHLDDHAARFGLTADDRVLQFSTLAFDAAFEQLLPILALGGTVVMRGPDPWEYATLNHRLAADRVTVAYLPTGYWRGWLAALPETVPADLRMLAVGAEALGGAALGRWREGPLGHLPLLNTYGPTEATITATGHLTGAADIAAAQVPIGRAWPSRRVLILDTHGNPVPEGGIGELCIGGPALARGYMARPGQTAERFVPDATGGPGARLYRTGDLCRREAGDVFRYLGRIDDQVKLRGYRIEPAEIEARIRAVPGIRDAAVGMIGAGEGARLVAHIVGEASPEDVRAALVRDLPGWMVPQAILPLYALPLTPAGKLDRRALPAPAADLPTHRAPESRAERLMAGLWSAVLGIENPGVTDDWFALGGDSIQSLQLVARARAAGLKLTTRQILEHPRIADLARLAVLISETNDLPAAPATDPFAAVRQVFAELGEPFDAVEDVYPATPLQQGLLFHARTGARDGLYVNQLRITIDGPVDRTALADAWQAAVARHPILRTRFEWRHGGEALQVVQRSATALVTEEDHGLADIAAHEARLAAWRAEDLARGFDLTHAPLARLAILHRPDGGRDLIWTVHHVITDGWSTARLLAEIATDYAARQAGGAADIPAPRPWRDYVAWAAARPDAAAWWQAQAARLADPVTLATAFGDVTPAEPDTADDISISLGDNLSESLRRLARRNGVTLASVMQGAWALLLARAGGGRQALFGITTAGRPPELDGVEAMQGPFINSLPLLVDIAPGRTLGAWLRDLHALGGALREVEHTPLARVQRWMGRSGDALFDSLLVFENYPADRALGDTAFGGRIAGVETTERTHYPLTLAIAPDAAITLGFGFDPARLPADLVARIAGLYRDLLARMADAADDLALGALRLTTATVPVVETTPGPDVVTRIAARIAATPTAIALRAGGEGRDYAALGLQAGGIARRLTGEAAVLPPDTPIGLCVTRGPDLVAGFLGILAAGGAVLALDPDLPDARLRLMLEDAGVTRVVVDAMGRARLAAIADDLTLVDAAGEGVPLVGADLHPGHLHPGQIAYLIYTSGSTGRPKPVAVSHGALAVHVDDYIARYGLTAEDRVLQVSTFGFDAAIEQLLPALTIGARVVMRGPTLWSAEEITAELAAQAVTVAYLPTGYWRMWQAGLGRVHLPALRLVTTGGEALAGAALADWLAGPLGHVPFLNSYGPTEATITVSAHRSRAADALLPVVPIGTAWGGRSLVVLDAEGDPVPEGGTGELCIGGPALARGYPGRPGLTAERFVPAPGGGRLYRTGDLARRGPDGAIRFLGRMDGQIKLRGFRIEPGEIEAALRNEAGIRDAAVVLAGQDATARLIAYVTGTADPERLKQALAHRLPGHMVPQVIMVLEALPLTPAGKLDRKALPAPDAPQALPVTLPRDEMEAALLDLWRGLLGRADFGIDDDVFDLGADSILSLQLVSRARRVGLVLTPAQVFEHPRIRDLAAAAARIGGAGAGPLDQGEIIGRALPLTPIQADFFETYPQGPSHWNQSVLLTVDGSIEPERVRDALDALVAAQDALRLRFRTDGEGRWTQTVAPDETAELLRVQAIGDDPADLDRAGEAIQASLNIRSGPLIRAGLFRRPSGDRLLIAIHHLAVDGVSWRILLEDLARGTATRPVLPWSRWVEAQTAYAAGPAVAAELPWWQAALGRAAPAFPAARSGDRRQHDQIFDAALTTRLITELPRRWRIGVDEVLLAALAATLAEDRPQLLVALEGHGREEVVEGADLSRTIGWFTTRFPVVVPVRGHPGDRGNPGDLLAGVKSALRSVPVKGLNWGWLRHGADPALAAAARALPAPDIGFNYLGRFGEAGAGDGGDSRFGFSREAAGRSVGVETSAGLALDVNAMVVDGRLSVSWRHDTGALAPDRLAVLTEGFAERLAALIDHALANEMRATPQDFDIDIDQDALDDLLAEIDG